MTDKTQRLSSLFAAAGLPWPAQLEDHEVCGVSDNSQRIEPGYVFVATKGVSTDSHLFISDAISRGARTVIVERDTPPYDKAQIFRVQDSRDVLGRLAHAWHHNPTLRFPVVAATGTNGKTTTVHMLEAILQKWLGSCGVIGTIEYRLGSWREQATNTTPGAIKLAALFAEMASRGAGAVAMEASSHALDQRRMSGAVVDVGILTNITQDHLDYHGTMEAYARAKALLFTDLLKNRREVAPDSRKPARPLAVILEDDEWCRGIARNLPTELNHLRLTTRPDACPDADLAALDIRAEGSRVRFTAHSKGGGCLAPFTVSIELPIPGLYNAANALCALGATCGMGCPPELAAQALATMRPVPGRLQPVRQGQNFEVLVDYAHTPDALENSLRNAREIAGTSGRVILVFGCGGDRDRAKRPVMGEIAIRMADTVIITDDNPRTESSESIIKQILEGVRPGDPESARHAAIPDRATAIRSAIGMATRGDVVLIAGKGHETYQEIQGRRIHFDDVEEATLALGGNPWKKTPPQ